MAMESYRVVAKLTAGVQWLLNTAFMQSPIGRVVTILFVLATACKFVYDHVDTIRERWNKMWGEFKTSCPVIAGVFETIASVLLTPYNLVCGFVDKVKELIGLGPVKVNSSADFRRADEASMSAQPKVSNGRATRASVQANASGGIYGKGAFLTTFAEESGESAIPHTPNKRNIGLLAKTNQIMGSPLQPNIKVYSQFNPVINAKAETPNINVQAPAITMPDIPPAVVKQPSINVQQADMAVPAPVIQIPESKPILQAPPVVKNIIQAVAGSPIVKTFVKAVAAVPDVTVNPESPVLKPIFTAMAKVPDVIVNQETMPPAYPQAPNVYPVVNVPKADTPIVNAMAKVTETAPILRPIVNPAMVQNVVNVPKMDAPGVSPVIQALAKTPVVTAMFNPQAQPAGLPDINVPQSTQKETLVERIKEIVRPQERAAETAPINITFSPNIVVNGNTDRQEVQQATEMSFQKFRELMEQFQREQRRVQYG